MVVEPLLAALGDPLVVVGHHPPELAPVQRAADGLGAGREGRRRRVVTAGQGQQRAPGQLGGRHTGQVQDRRRHVEQRHRGLRPPRGHARAPHQQRDAQQLVVQRVAVLEVVVVPELLPVVGEEHHRDLRAQLVEQIAELVVEVAQVLVVAVDHVPLEHLAVLAVGRQHLRPRRVAGIEALRGLACPDPPVGAGLVVGQVHVHEVEHRHRRPVGVPGEEGLQLLDHALRGRPVHAVVA